MSVDLGFETIGNATITAFDSGKPVLSTDPWIFGQPYFGSWTHKYEIPKNQIDNVYSSKFIWLSHGHPDHLDVESLKLIKNSKILVPDHFGERIFNDLKHLGFNVSIIKSNSWTQLSENINIKSFSDYNQDAALLIDIAGKDLIVNLNDGSLRGTEQTVVNETHKFKNRFLLRLIGSKEADMLNLYDINGNFIMHEELANNDYIGIWYSKLMNRYNCNYSIPFSVFHQYQREDSIHMNQYIKPIEEHFIGFDKRKGNILPGFIIWNTEKEEYEQINPKSISAKSLPPSHFGDSWSDNLDKSDKKILDNYFLKIETIKKNIGVIHFNCGEIIHPIKISNCKNEILFHVPRNSLIKAVKYNVFDDLLIGNFMKTTLININSLYPYFTPYVAKYSDNGNVYNELQYKKYIDYYYNIAGSKYHFIKQRIIRQYVAKVRYRLQNSSAFSFARYIYRAFI